MSFWDPCVPLRVLRAAAAAGVTRFGHVSSVAAYGFDFRDGVDESDPVWVSGYSYVDTKVNSEHGPRRLRLADRSAHPAREGATWFVLGQAHGNLAPHPHR